MHKKIIKSLLRKTESSKIENIKTCLETILEMDEAELIISREGLNECLEVMEKELKRIHSQANGYPNSSIAGGIWFDGTALANYAETLANYLSNKDFLEEQAKATNLWTGAVLSVCSHYHHMVGPAMIANAEISERTGNLEYTKTAYSAVLQDFECILEYAEEDEYKPEGDNLVALQSLKTAVTRLIEFNEISGVNIAAPEILERVKTVMDKPKSPDGGN